VLQRTCTACSSSNTRLAQKKLEWGVHSSGYGVCIAAGIRRAPTPAVLCAELVSQHRTTANIMQVEADDRDCCQAVAVALLQAPLLVGWMDVVLSSSLPSPVVVLLTASGGGQ
jgi:hypothetical protein